MAKTVSNLEVGESGPDFLLDHMDPTGAPRPDVWRQAVADFYQLDLDASVLWNQIGPAPLVVDPNTDQIYMGIGPDAGEVTDILIDPTDANDQTIYITTDDGGIWKTIDGGTNWTPLTDQMFSISMGAVAMDPTNPKILYGGSGNLFDGGIAFTKGAGIYRTADAGLTWSIVDGGYFGTVFANVGINRIVCPVADCLLVATNQGLYRSVDAGRNFGANAPTFNDHQPVVAGRICCLLLDTADPANTVYAGVAGSSTDATGAPLPMLGLLKSTDAGVTFPTNLFSSIVFPVSPYGSFVVAQSQFDGTTANNAVFYASVQKRLANGKADYIGLYRSVDSGVTWKLLNSLRAVATGNGFLQTNYDLTIGVDPLNSKRVYAGFQQVWLSVDGGTTFASTAITSFKVHWDNHSVVFSPAANRPATSPVTVYTGTDGGIAKSVDGGATWTAINGAIAASLFRGIDIGKSGTVSPTPANNAYTYGGCQDTGTCGHRPGDLAGQWHSGINGDGWLVAVDPTNPLIVYGFDDNLFIKTMDAGGHWVYSDGNARTIGINLTNPQNTLHRAIAIDLTGTVPATRTVYVGEENVLLKSTNAGVTFTKTKLVASSNAAPFGYVTCIVTTTADPKIVWAGADDGTVHASTDGGGTWDATPFVTTPAGPGVGIGPVNGIAIDPTKPVRVAVVFGGVSGINSKFKTQHVFLTEDSGATWFDISGTDGLGPVGNLPDLTLRSVVFDTSTPTPGIIVAGDAGVLRSIDATITGTNPVGTASWKIYGAGLPMVCCNSLAIDNTVKPPVLRVGTYGRSCFEVSRPTGPSFAADSNLAFGTVATGQSVTLSIWVYNCGDANLDISGTGIVGPGVFAFGTTPALPVSVLPAATQEFQVTFSPTATGDAFVLLQLTTNDTTQPVRLIPASGTGINTALLPRLATNPITSAGFGSSDLAVPRSIAVQLFNVGAAPLNISAINQTGSNDFSLNPAPAFPLTIPPGGESDLVITFTPSGAGGLSASFSIVSDDALSPLVVSATGTGIQPSASSWRQFLNFLGLAHPTP